MMKDYERINNLILAYDQHAKDLLEAFKAVSDRDIDAYDYVQKYNLLKPDYVTQEQWSTAYGWRVAIRQHIMGKE